jgi:MoxR-like ATPase
MEEVNALRPQQQKLLNAATDFREKLEIPECQRVFKLREGAKLWVVGTMNTAVYGGVYALNEDLKSRFRLLPLDYVDMENEKKILRAVLKGTGVKVPEPTVNNVLTMAQQTRQKALDYALSTRDLVQVLEDIHLIGLNRALWTLTGKFEGDDRSTIKEWMHSIFAVRVP